MDIAFQWYVCHPLAFLLLRHCTPVDNMELEHCLDTATYNMCRLQPKQGSLGLEFNPKQNTVQ